MPNTSDERPESPPESGATPKPGRRRSRLPVLILLVAVVAGVGVYGSGLFTRFLPLGLLGTQQDSEAVLG
ncbi:MAG TPA: hypothetical protein VK463_04230, partial [Desulfomonilaceae bacterium]|nr:hypothetical protein [Desulfomonilaceae bacterium]